MFGLMTKYVGGFLPQEGLMGEIATEPPSFITLYEADSAPQESFDAIPGNALIPVLGVVLIVIFFVCTIVCCCCSCCLRRCVPPNNKLVKLIFFAVTGVAALLMVLAAVMSAVSFNRIRGMYNTLADGIISPVASGLSEDPPFKPLIDDLLDNADGVLVQVQELATDLTGFADSIIDKVVDVLSDNIADPANAVLGRVAEIEEIIRGIGEGVGTDIEDTFMDMIPSGLLDADTGEITRESIQIFIESLGLGGFGLPTDQIAAIVGQISLDKEEMYDIVRDMFDLELPFSFGGSEDEVMSLDRFLEHLTNYKDAIEFGLDMTGLADNTAGQWAGRVLKSPGGYVMLLWLVLGIVFYLTVGCALCCRGKHSSRCMQCWQCSCCSCCNGCLITAGIISFVISLVAMLVVAFLHMDSGDLEAAMGPGIVSAAGFPISLQGVLNELAVDPLTEMLNSLLGIETAQNHRDPSTPPDTSSTLATQRFFTRDVGSNSESSGGNTDAGGLLGDMGIVITPEMVSNLVSDMITGITQLLKGTDKQLLSLLGLTTFIHQVFDGIDGHAILNAFVASQMDASTPSSHPELEAWQQWLLAMIPTDMLMDGIDLDETMAQLEIFETDIANSLRAEFEEICESINELPLVFLGSDSEAMNTLRRLCVHINTADIFETIVEFMEIYEELPPGVKDQLGEIPEEFTLYPTALSDMSDVLSELRVELENLVAALSGVPLGVVTSLSSDVIDLIDGVIRLVPDIVDTIDGLKILDATPLSNMLRSVEKAITSELPALPADLATAFMLMSVGALLALAGGLMGICAFSKPKIKKKDAAAKKKGHMRGSVDIAVKGNDKTTRRASSSSDSLGSYSSYSSRRK